MALTFPLATMHLHVARLVFFAAVVSALPVDAQTFTDASDLLPSITPFGFGGTAVMDVDGDGRTDLAATNALLLFRGDGFEALPLGENPIGSVYGDVDGDGRRDVLVLNTQEPEVFRYNPARASLQPFPGGGLNVSLGLVQGSVMLDYDRDGALDVLIGNDGGIDILLRGLGGGVFVDVSDETLPQLDRGTYGMMAADYDRDGDTDVYVGLCVGETENLLYRNEGGTFDEVAAAAGVHDARSTWGVIWFDFDNDGWLDSFSVNMPLAGSGMNRLYRNNADGTFTDVAAAAGVAGRTVDTGWTATAADFDNDGWLDLLLVNDPQPSKLYHNNADGTFTDIAASAGLSGLTGLPAASGDVNDDGWPDLYVIRNSNSEQILFLNDGGTNGWLGVDLVGVASNRDGIGARVEVVADDFSMVREITAGDGFMSHSHGLRAHFGLGTATSADVTIRWPSGTVEAIAGVAANQVITVVEGLGANAPPGMFALTSPADGEAVPAGEPVTLGWDEATDADAVGYTVYLAAPNGADTVFETTETEFVVPASALADAGTYQWAVVASDGHSSRTSLDNASFTNVPVANEAAAEPTVLALAVWPNPARTEATVRFELAASESLWLEVYDALGRCVERSALGVRGTGTHTAQLDLSRHPVGVYVIRLLGSRGEAATVRVLRIG